MRTRQGPFPMETASIWDARATGTHLTHRNRGTPTGFSRLAGLAMAPAMRRADREDLTRLEQVLEATGRS